MKPTPGRGVTERRANGRNDFARAGHARRCSELTAALLTAAVFLPAVPVSAQDALGDEYVIIEDIYEWTAPAVEVQLEQDKTDVPRQRGAVFVPSLSQSADEPEALVFDRGDRIGSGPTGERILVTPGVYTVRVGSGTIQQTLAIPDVEVRAGETTVIPVEWGGLRIDTVDENNVPFRGDYEIIRVSDRELFGLGFGADTLLGERLQTWLLPPGLYRIVQPGASYRARTDFSTVVVPQGGLVNYKLVLDPATGEFRGAGVVTAEELGVAEGISAWTRRFVVGLNAGLAHTDRFVGLPDQVSLSGDLFVDVYVAYDRRQNFLVGIFELEEGVIHVRPAEGDPFPLQKSRDRLRLDALYTYFVNQYMGPYLRFGTLASLFPTTVVVTEDTTILRLRADGTQETEFVSASNAFRIGGPLSRVELREGAGMNVRLLRTTLATLNFRLGFGFRQNFFNEVFIVDDDAATSEIEYREQEDFNQEGVESTLTGNVRLTRFLSYTTDLELFVAFDDFAKPRLDWQNTLSFRVSPFAALDYRLDILKEPRVTDDTQLRQNVLLRLSFDIL